MLENGHSSRFAFILHADIVGSTDLVQQDERIAHGKIRDALTRLSNAVRDYNGTTHEIRGDALVAEFEKASDAVCAALVYQEANEALSRSKTGASPRVRIGIAMGEVVVANRTVTGAGVVLAQRLEQLAEAGEVVVQGAACESIPQRMPFSFASLGEHDVKGFDRPVRGYRAATAPGRSLPQPSNRSVLRSIGSWPNGRNLRIAMTLAVIAALILSFAWWQPWRSDIPAASTTRMSHSLPDKPSIAVLPFTVANDGEDNAYVGSEFADLVRFSLASTPALFVVARDSSIIFQGAAVERKRIAEDLGVRYLVEGEVSIDETTAHVAVRLTDAIEGDIAWKDRFKQPVENIAALRDTVADGIVKSLPVEFDQAIMRPQPLSEDPVALDFYLRGQFLLNRVTASETARAREMYLQAVDRDPKFAAALASLALSYLQELRYGWNTSGETAFAQARKALDRALAVEPETATAQVAGAEMALLENAPDKAREFALRAVELNPGCAQAWALQGEALSRTGDPESAVASFRRAMRINPYPPVFYESGLGFALLLAGDIEEARERLQRAVEIAPGVTDAEILLTAAYQMAGSSDEAQRQAAQVLKIDPGFKVDAWINRERLGASGFAGKLADALKKAGLPGKQPEVIEYETTGRK
jgi:class 3 adenylate cyclase/TolB-like protein/Tfp pilus assembly protein PilF